MQASQSSKSNLKLSPDPLVLDVMAHLGPVVLKVPLGCDSFGAGELRGQPRAGPVLSGNIPVILRLLDSIKQTESAVGLD